MEDGIPGRLQHRHETCCEKGGRCGRRACRVQRWHHRGDVVFRTGGLVYDKQGTNHYWPQQKDSGYTCGRRIGGLDIIHENMNAETEVLLQSMPLECNIEKGKGYDDMISCTIVVSVSTSCSRCYNFALSLQSPHVTLLICLMYCTLFPYFILVYITQILSCILTLYHLYTSLDFSQVFA